MAQTSTSVNPTAVYAHLVAADRESPLEPEDLARLATAAYLTGREAESAGFWGRAHHGFHDRNQPAAAARSAFWLAYGLLDKGESAQASGWLARARRLLDECGQDCVERGYLLLPEALRSMAEGDCERAAGTFRLAAQAGERFGDADLVALARHGEGRALIRLGRTAPGLELLDEAMVAVTAGEVSPLAAGDVYCGVISGCQEVFDWRRAQEWTAALARWCDGQPDLVPYRGQCLLRRSEVLQLHGDWRAALDEAHRACERLSEPAGQAGLGAAFYQLAELHRLRGDLAEAEEAYRQASLHGRRPQPGLALLRLARGEVAAAARRHRRCRERERRAAQPVPAASRPGRDRARRAATSPWRGPPSRSWPRSPRTSGRPISRRVGSGCRALRLAEGDARGALASLREAEAIWRELGAPYETARTRVLIGRRLPRAGRRARGAAWSWRPRARSSAARCRAGPGPGGAARAAAGARRRGRAGSARARYRSSA